MNVIKTGNDSRKPGVKQAPSFIASRDKLLRSDWVSTSSNDLIRDTLQRHALRVQPAIEALLEGDAEALEEQLQAFTTNLLSYQVAKPGKRTPKQALAEGLAQIQANDYGAELRAAGASPVRAFAVAFDGKRVSVRAAKA